MPNRNANAMRSAARLGSQFYFRHWLTSVRQNGSRSYVTQDYGLQESQ